MNFSQREWSGGQIRLRRFCPGVCAFHYVFSDRIVGGCTEQVEEIGGRILQLYFQCLVVYRFYPDLVSADLSFVVGEAVFR